MSDFMGETVDAIMFVHCYRSGEIEVSTEKEIPGCIRVARGDRNTLDRKLSARARHASDGETLLVPGLPEADTDEQALDAVAEFIHHMERPLPADH